MDWKKKLTSRKFWMAIANFVTGLIVFISCPDGSPEKITALIMSFGGVIAYIVGEGMIDAASAGKDEYTIEDGAIIHPPETEVQEAQ